MFMTVLRESLLAFLFIYAILSIAEECLQFITLHLKKKQETLPYFYCIIPKEEDELFEWKLRLFLKEHPGPIIVLTDASPDIEKTVSCLAKEYPFIMPVKESQLSYISQWIETLSDFSKSDKEEDLNKRN